MIGEVGVITNGHTHLFRFKATPDGIRALIDHWEALVTNPDKNDLTSVDFLALGTELHKMIVEANFAFA